MAGTQPKSFPLFLRPSLAAKDNEGALTRQIQEIVAAKGHLRNVTEASLQADITSDDAGVTREEDPGSAEEEDVGDERGAIEHLRKVKQEMVGVIGYAVSNPS